jgi:hypothetical protein
LQVVEDKSFFHGTAKDGANYKGDSWLVPPKDKKKENEHCYIPKKWIHTWYAPRGVQVANRSIRVWHGATENGS